ncbi:MAG: SusC/RagA family TonB-linked outer membrane protein [Mangrovibacterium sp.]
MKIDLHFQNLSLPEILSSIEEKSEFIFIYNANVVNMEVKKSISARNEKIEKILELLFEGTDVEYEIDDRQIFLYKSKDLEKKELIDKKIEPDQSLQLPEKKTIQGKVTDTKGQPIPGTTVLVKGTNIGTVTNPDGLFTLEIPVESKILAFSFVGYESQEILIGNKNRLDIILEEMTIGLEEVVAVGYGTQKKESVVGAISQVNNEVLIRGGNTNVSNAMTGKLSGVLGMQETGEPGKDQAEIIVRGLSSWNGSVPLVLVDGVERGFSDLDPNEVNTISVLKDASATAVFGAKGANGVILITTKRGIQSKPKLEFSASMGIQRATKSYEFVDSYTTMSMLNVAYKNGQQFSDVIPDNILNEYRNPSTPLNAIRYPSVNWYKELTRTFAPTYTGNLSVRGGTNFVKYYSSIGYTYQGSFFKGYHDGYVDTRFKYNRINYRSNLDFNLSKTTQLSFTIGGDIDIKNTPGSSPWKGIFQSSPARFPMVFPAWVLNEVPDTDYPDASGKRLAQAIGEQGGNPYSILFQGTFSRDLGTTLFTDAVLEQKLDFILKGLFFRGESVIKYLLCQYDPEKCV